MALLSSTMALKLAFGRPSPRLLSKNSESIVDMENSGQDVLPACKVFESTDGNWGMVAEQDADTIPRSAVDVVLEKAVQAPADSS